MTTNEPSNSKNWDPIEMIQNTPTPDHAPGFWDQLEANLEAETPKAVAPPKLAIVPPIEAPAGSRPAGLVSSTNIDTSGDTAKTAVLSSSDDREIPLVAIPSAPSGAASRRRQPVLAIAAALLLVVGIAGGLFALNRGDSPTPVATNPELGDDSGAVADDGADSDDDDGSDSEADSVDGDDTPATEDDSSDDEAGEDGDEDSLDNTDDDITDNADVDDTDSAPPANDVDSNDGPVPTTEAAPTTTEPAPTTTAAAPTTTEPPSTTTPEPPADDELQTPNDDGLPNNARFLGTAPDLGVTWFAVESTGPSCDGSEVLTAIKAVDANGNTSDAHDAEAYFAGYIDEVIYSEAARLMTFIVSCPASDDFTVFAAEIAADGTFLTETLLITSDAGDDFVSLRIEGLEVLMEWTTPSGEDNLYSWNVGSDELINLLEETNNTPDGPVLFETPVAMSANGAFSYFNGSNPDGTGGCEGEAITLWVVQHGETELVRRALDSTVSIGVVTAMAEAGDGRVAFAEGCEGFAGTVSVGTVRADGTIAVTETFDMMEVPGEDGLVLGYVDSLEFSSGRLVVSTVGASAGVPDRNFLIDLN